jgi:hypothetical protein
MARTLTNDILAAAVAGCEAQKAKIDAQIAELRQTLKGSRIESASATPPEPAKGRRKLSAAGRRAIAAAAKKRWAAIKAANGAGTPKPRKAKKSIVKRTVAKKAAKKL